jgi:hypothetical protein
VEIQGKADPGFARRMYMYNYRLFDKHDRKIISLAVLTDSRKNWRPDHYGYELCGCKVELVFPVAKLLDYRENWDDLEKSDNPFSVVVMAHLKHLETRRDMDNRLKWKSSLVKMLYQRGYLREDILELFRFIDWILRLPEDMEERFSDEIYRYEEDMRMPYVTSVERQGMKKGQEIGIQEGALLTFREAVVNVLEARFGAIPKSVKNKIGLIDDPDLLKMLLGKAVVANSLKDFKEILGGAGLKANA